MVCRPFQLAGNQSEATYGRKMTGEGTTYQEQRKGRVKCGEMQEGDGGRVAGILPDDASRKGEGGTVELGSLSHRRRPTNILDNFPDQGRDKELPCGGLPRKGWYMDDDEDAFL